MHIVRDISWEGYTDWTVGTKDDYGAIFQNIEMLDSILVQSFNDYYWTSSSYISYRYYFRFWIKGTVNSLTGVTTYAWDYFSNNRSSSYDYKLRPIRYF